MNSSEIAIGDRIFDRETGRLRDAGGREIELRHQSREVLKLLAETPGDTVTRDTFLQRVWDGANVSEDSLAQCIVDIRQAFGDTERNLIETIPRKGYRLNAVPVPPERSRRAAWIGLVAAAAVLAVGYLSFWPTAEVKRVIAVLPFHDISPTEQQGLLADPISDGVLAYLARYPELTVIARGSSFRFRDPDRDMPHIGALLGADYLVEGSLNFDGKRVAVNASLIDVETNAQVWSDRIDTGLEDLMSMTEDMGKRIAFQMVDHVGALQVAEAGRVRPDSFLYSMQARKASLGRLSPEVNTTAIALNREAVRLYPDEAWGHLGLALALRTQLRFGWADDPEATLAEAADHAETAVRLAPDNYSAHFALGRVRMQQGNQFRAIEAFEAALHLNPSSADTMNAMAQSYLYLGQDQQALEILAQSRRIDPLPGFIHPWMSAWVLWQDGQCEQARDAFGRIAAPPPEAHKLLAVIRICLNEPDAARRALSEFLSANPDWTGAREAAIHDGVWTYDTGRERWLADLAAAGLPDG